MGIIDDAQREIDRAKQAIVAAGTIYIGNSLLPIRFWQLWPLHVSYRECEIGLDEYREAVQRLEEITAKLRRRIERMEE